MRTKAYVGGTDTGVDGPQVSFPLPTVERDNHPNLGG
jgi:hypothetical protein